MADIAGAEGLYYIYGSMVLNLSLFERIFGLPGRRAKALIASYVLMLEAGFPFYRRLSAADRQRFAERVFRFRRSKRFHFLEMEEQEEVAVLVSASAIQLTFGLPEYTFSFFDDVYIIKGVYTYGLGNAPWVGHVNRKGIHVAWDHVQKGYHSETDGYNVGLHEMAHAMEYELAYGDYLDDSTLRSNFRLVNTFIKDRLLGQTDVASLYTEYGLSNVHECWAESIELFFEKPVALQQYYPELYDWIRQMLNQHPLVMQNVYTP